jgi:hypothetical protein
VHLAVAIDKEDVIYGRMGLKKKLQSSISGAGGSEGLTQVECNHIRA